jgi:hypothetical protein
MHQTGKKSYSLEADFCTLLKATFGRLTYIDHIRKILAIIEASIHIVILGH